MEVNLPVDLLINGAPCVGTTELSEGQAVEFSATPPPGATLALWAGAAPLEPFLRPGEVAWRWRWAAPQAAGTYPLRLRLVWSDGRVEEQRYRLRVRPGKLDQERYEALCADLQRLRRALVTALSGGAEPLVARSAAFPWPPDPVEEFHRLSGAEFERFAAAVERLAARPPDRLRPALRQVRLGQLRSAAGLRAVLHDRDTALISASIAGYDSYEARLLRGLLDDLSRRLETLTAALDLPVALAERAGAVRARLRALRAQPFLAGVPPLDGYRGPTPRLLRDSDYRIVHRFWRLMRQQGEVRWEETPLAVPVADLPRLYERWCVARVALTLLEWPGHTLVSQALLAEDDEGRPGLTEDEPLVVLARPDGSELRLRYHPRYRPFAETGRPPLPGKPSLSIGSLDRHVRIPDLGLEIWRPGAAPRLLALDAKYRLDAAGGVPAEALAEAYSYLGGLGAPDGARAALGVALLYPGTGAPECYPSGVAALPLLPGATTALTAWLAEFL
ncbi:MAG: nuclease domain-containing protein [Oscillochloridaceae bacterium]|nr:restriction endonuclease-like protein [Chloroflexaceae bacterium]MDW8389644.1 nuclease domain-containing protein [Oscillochloridaceae bacterium]